jgi:hypothetical protein
VRPSCLAGQNYALLENAASAPSDANGVTSWTGFGVSAASSRFLHLYFYSEGVVSSWNEPGQQPAATDLRPPHYAPPVFMDAGVGSLAQLQLYPNASLLPINCAGPASPPSVVEGDTLAEPLRVRVLDTSGAPKAGVRLVAVIKSAAGIRLPHLVRP